MNLFRSTIILSAAILVMSISAFGQKNDPPKNPPPKDPPPKINPQPKDPPKGTKPQKPGFALNDNTIYINKFYV